MTLHESSADRDVQPQGEEEPLCTEEEFAEEVRELVVDQAPQLFALVEEYGERIDGRIIAWGMAFDDHVEAITVSGEVRMTFDTVERALWRFSQRRKVRLVWTSPAPSARAGGLTRRVGIQSAQSRELDLTDVGAARLSGSTPPLSGPPRQGSTHDR